MVATLHIVNINKKDEEAEYRPLRDPTSLLSLFHTVETIWVDWVSPHWEVRKVQLFWRNTIKGVCTLSMVSISLYLSYLSCLSYKKNYRTDRIHSISYNTLYLSFLLYWAVVREVSIKPGFHIVVSVVPVVSVVRKKFIGEIQLYGNLPFLEGCILRASFDPIESR